MLCSEACTWPDNIDHPCMWKIEIVAREYTLSKNALPAHHLIRLGPWISHCFLSSATTDHTPSSRDVLRRVPTFTSDARWCGQPGAGNPVRACLVLHQYMLGTHNPVRDSCPQAPAFTPAESTAAAVHVDTAGNNGQGTGGSEGDGRHGFRAREASGWRCHSRPSLGGSIAPLSYSPSTQPPA